MDSPVKASKRLTLRAALTSAACAVPVLFASPASAESITYGWCKATVDGRAFYSTIWSRADDEAGHSPAYTFKQDIDARTKKSADVTCEEAPSEAKAKSDRDADIAKTQAAGGAVTVTTGSY